MPAKMLTVAEIARRLDLPDQRLYHLVKNGVLKPDAVASRSALFKESSIARVEAALAQLFGRARRIRI
jgi:hypothetical protein